MNQSEVLTQMQDVFDRIFIAKVPLTPSLTAKEVPEWDSLMHITLLFELEKRFKVKFKTGELESIPTVGQLAELISVRLGK